MLFGSLVNETDGFHKARAHFSERNKNYTVAPKIFYVASVASSEIGRCFPPAFMLHGELESERKTTAATISCSTIIKRSIVKKKEFLFDNLQTRKMYSNFREYSIEFSSLNLFIASLLKMKEHPFIFIILYSTHCTKIT